MTTVAVTDSLDDHRTDDRYAVVLCGSFHRATERLRQTFDVLGAQYRLLSPHAVEWIDPRAEFVRAPSESDEPACEIEGRHLAAVRAADFVWLHCPDGYVGTSAAMEVGYAHAIGVPVITDRLPSDESVAVMVQIAPEPATAHKVLEPTPGRGLGALQAYYERVARRRGWADESAQDTLLLLTEEFGELARAVRKEVGLARDGAYPSSAIADELADVQLYVVHLANVLGIDLDNAVTNKERENARRYEQRRAYPAA